ncbi:hypothetical protein J8273_5036 [Carpediemonas membranifera]|uniref:Uncharacterized protein n=1 Tax=Carpediemonas membranifera TaxID=201153 RepID=A0A8J6DZF4_9EUKA|nr:hypothetical protein J8273_5036 [Carpediemonas membranifera]|eukprot:KAG9393549.1 hypothetical protein J8273_5036 [Carpediemonas membranifera]
MMPRALEVCSDELTHIARTPKGLWGWGYSDGGQLGFESDGFGDPTRLTFPACPDVAELEASLPPWEKHRMVTDVSMKGGQSFILTPVGTVTAGEDAVLFAGRVEENSYRFNPVAVPTGFVPERVMHDECTVILSMGARQVISGDNGYGRLGLGHENEMTGFVDLPFRVDRIMPSSDEFAVYISRRQLLFAGLVGQHIAQTGLLPDTDFCYTPTPLRFPCSVQAWCCTDLALVWVCPGQTHFSERYPHRQITVPFEATAFATSEHVVCFQQPSGQWFETGLQGDVVECCAPEMSYRIDRVQFLA